MHQRFNKGSVDFLKKSLELVLKKVHRNAKHQTITLFQTFSRVCIWDSSGWELRKQLKQDFPGSGGSASAAGCKIQCVYDLKSSTLVHLDLTNGRTPDQQYSAKVSRWVKANDLVLFDLGYFCLLTFATIIKQGAYFLSRLLQGTKVYVVEQGAEKELDLFSLVQQYKNITAFELPVLVGTRKIPCRLIFARLPQHQCNKRLRELKKQANNNGRTLSKRSKTLASWNLYITNAPVTALNTLQVIQAYPLRWSIELLFKQFKSIVGIHRSNHSNKFRLQCEIYGALIVAALLLLIHGCLQQYLWKNDSLELSFDKLFKYFKNSAHLLFEILTSPAYLSLKLLRSSLHFICLHCIKVSQPSRLSSLKKFSLASPQSMAHALP